MLPWNDRCVMHPVVPGGYVVALREVRRFVQYRVGSRAVVGEEPAH